MLIPYFIRAGLIYALTVVCGCASALQSSQLLSERPPTLTSKAFIKLPAFGQDRHQCGATSLAEVLQWSGESKITPAELEGEVFLPLREGTLQSDLLLAARRHNRLSYVLDPSLKTLLEEVSAGHPVVVLTNLSLEWFPLWHYMVVMGYDLDQEVVFAHTGTNETEAITMSRFENIWRRGSYWAALVLPPTELPHSADRFRYLQAVNGLENSHKFTEALSAYQTALQRWPNDLDLKLALANANIEVGNTTESEIIFRQILTEAPQNTPALNNFSLLLARTNRCGEAKKLLLNCIQLHDKFEAYCHRSWEEIGGQCKV